MLSINRMENSELETLSMHNISQLQAENPWILGIVTDITGPLLYKVKLTNGTEVHHHYDILE